MLMLMSTQFSLAYTRACAYAYAYVLVETRLKKNLGREVIMRLSLVFISA